LSADDTLVCQFQNGGLVRLTHRCVTSWEFLITHVVMLPYEKFINIQQRSVKLM
jgi:hypothetical protein